MIRWLTSSWASNSKKTIRTKMPGLNSDEIAEYLTNKRLMSPQDKRLDARQNQPRNRSCWSKKSALISLQVCKQLLEKLCSIKLSRGTARLKKMLISNASTSNWMWELSKNAMPKTTKKAKNAYPGTCNHKIENRLKDRQHYSEHSRGPAGIPKKAASFPQQKHWKKRPLNSRGVKQQKLCTLRTTKGDTGYRRRIDCGQPDCVQCR